MENLHTQADKLLRAIAAGQANLAEAEREMAEAIEAVKQPYMDYIVPMQVFLSGLEKELVALMKKNKNEFFSDEVDRVDLTHGSLLHKLRDVVKRSRKVTAALLEKLGYAEAVKVVKTVDWDSIEKWPDLKLAEIGTERKPSEKFEYELKAEGK